VRKWVFAVARHRVVDDARRRARRPKVDGAPVPDLPGRPVAASDELVDPVLLAALAQLTPDQREVVLLRFVADLPLEAVARITRRRLGAVKALQHRALTQLGLAVSRTTERTL
jgi:RNA polymerase sigma-70 factor (ECF subfamily)